ncbi:MAG: ribosome recycling factor [Myxococcota bacterium]
MAEGDLFVEEAQKGMQKSVESLQHDLSRIRTGRANPALLDGVQVDYYGTPTPLRQLATLNAPEARLLTVQPFDSSTLPQIERAILKADLGLSPVNDKKILRVPIPELTEERRKELCKQVKKMAEEHKVGVRSARRDAMSQIKDAEKEGDLAKDESHRVQKKIEDVTHEFTEKIDQVVAAKEEEILRV